MRKSAMIGIGVMAAALAVAGVTATMAGSGQSGTTAVRFVDSTTPISQDDAEKAALAQVPDGHVTETELDTEDGQPVWHVHLSTSAGEHEVKVDAETGAVRVDDRDDSSTSTDSPDAEDATSHDADDEHGESDDGPNHH